MKQVRILSMYINVLNTKKLYLAALRHAVEVDGVEQGAAHAILKPSGTVDIDACLHMLLDPAKAPHGTEIIYSKVTHERRSI